MIKKIKLAEDKFIYMIPHTSPTGVFFAMENFVGDDGELYYARKFYRGFSNDDAALNYHVHICKTGLLMSVSDYVIHKDSGEVKQLTEADLKQFEEKPILRDSYLRVVSSTNNKLVWEKEEELDNRLGMYYKVLEDSDYGKYGELVKYISCSMVDGQETIMLRGSNLAVYQLNTSIERLVKSHKLRALLRMSYPTEDLEAIFGSGVGVVL